MILLWKVPTRRSFFKWRVCRPSAWLRGPKSSPPLFDVWILLLSAKQTNEYVISAERFSQYLHTYLLCIVTSRSDLIRWCSLSIVRYLPTYLPTFIRNDYYAHTSLCCVQFLLRKKLSLLETSNFNPVLLKLLLTFLTKIFPSLSLRRKEKQTEKEKVTIKQKRKNGYAIALVISEKDSRC